MPLPATGFAKTALVTQVQEDGKYSHRVLTKCRPKGFISRSRHKRYHQRPTRSRFDGGTQSVPMRAEDKSFMHDTASGHTSPLSIASLVLLHTEIAKHMLK